MALLSRLSKALVAAVMALPGSKAAAREMAQILDRSKATLFSDETHLPGYFTTVEAASFATDEGDCDVAMESTGSIASILMDSPTSHSISFFVTDALSQLSLAGTTGNVYITMSDNRAVALSIRIASGNSLIDFRSTNSDEAVMIAPAAGQKVGFFGATPVVQAAHIADPSGGATQDAEARTAINAILVRLENLGINATS